EREAWASICDEHLLNHLLVEKGRSTRYLFLFLFGSLFSLIISLAGPAWIQVPAPTYKQIQPRVILLDLSEAMLESDLSPNRLSRAKFKLHDLFKLPDIGQLGLIVFTGESFVASPLTDDAQTVDALLDSLSPDIMPVEGHRLDRALEEAKKLINQAG